MKNWIFIGWLLIGVTACESNPNGADASDSAGQPKTAQVKAGTAGFRAAIPVAINSREAQALIKDYWVFELYIDPNNPLNNRPNRGKWFKLNPNGTFESGHWDKKTGYGSWGLGMSEKNEYVVVHFDNQIAAEDSEYMLQGLTEDGDAMSWVGTDLYGQGHIMVKTMQLMTMPTKQQFGVEE